jgi:UrcA family protein
MYLKMPLLSSRVLLGSVLACALFSGTAGADNQRVIVSKQIDTSGLDLNRPADAQTLYTRIRHAADDVCTRGKQVDLAPVDDPKRCYEKALGNAIRLAKLPMLTQIYLTTHSVQEAAARGIEVPSQVAGTR